MPELAEVERARKSLHQGAVGKTITDAASHPDEIVFGSKADAERFPEAIKGRKILDVQRKGKQFWMLLNGEGPHPLFHFGMSGFCTFKGQEPLYYRKKPKETSDEWPPRYHRASLTLTADDGSVDHWAFMDARRLGRVKLIDAADPRTEPPLSLLGRDPLLDMMSHEELKEALSKRSAPLKAVLLDQNALFAGLGNWLVDEICFHALIHPAQVASTLSDEQISELHRSIKLVINTAVETDADHTKFPDGWLFPHRWSKGKKGAQLSFQMDNGETTKIKFETVGGRTTAICDVQKLPAGHAAMAKKAKSKGGKRKKEEDVDGDGSGVEEPSEEEKAPKDEDKGEGGASPSPRKSRRT